MKTSDSSKKRWGALGVAVAAALLLTACTADGGTPPAADTDTDLSYFSKTGGRDGECTAETMGGDITMGTQNEAPSLDPIGPGSSSSVNQTLAIYGTLLLWNADEDAYEMNLAKGIEPNDDHTSWTLTLRDDVTFGDGSPLDADAVVAAFGRWSSGLPTNAAVAYRVAFASSVTAVDATTVRFDLAAPWVDFPWLLSTVAGQIPNPAVSDEELALGTNPAAGAGAFQVSKWTRGDSLVLEKKDDWWGGPVCLDTVSFITPASADARADAFRQGELDVVMVWSNTEVSGGLIDDGIAGVTWPLRAGFTFNMRNDSFVSDPAIRVALQQAVDPAGMSQRLTEGFNAPETTLVATSTELGADLKGIAYDAEAAKATLDEAKADGWDGKIVLLSTQIPADLQFTNQLAAYLEAAGAETEVKSVEIGEFVSMITSGEGYDIQLAGGGEMLRECLSCGLDAYNSASPSAYGFSDERVDELSARFDSTADPDTRHEMVDEFQELWNETAPRLVWGQQFYLMGWSDDLHGVRPSIKDTIDLSRAYLGS